MTAQTAQAQVLINPPIITIINEQPRTLSTDVAAYFGKSHSVVMRQLRNLLENLPKDKEEWGRCNFALTSYTDEQGRPQPCYSMTKDGFVLLAMGFTGPKAILFKITYIEAFSSMEAELRGGFTLRPDGSPDALSTVKDRKPLNALINTWVSLAPLSYRDAWQQVKAASGVENADGLTVSQIKPACEFVQARLDAVIASAPAKVPLDVVEAIMKASHQNLAYQKTVNRLYLDVCQVLRELDNQLFADWKKLNDCFMSLTSRPVKAA